MDIVRGTDHPRLKEWSAVHLGDLFAAGVPHPKETLEWVCRLSRTPRSSSVYPKVAGPVSLARCVDPEAMRLVESLRRWFPVE